MPKANLSQLHNPPHMKREAEENMLRAALEIKNAELIVELVVQRLEHENPKFLEDMGNRISRIAWEKL